VLCNLQSGIYGDAVTLETLKDFHRRRAQASADLVATGGTLSAAIKLLGEKTAPFYMNSS